MLETVSSPRLLWCYRSGKSLLSQEWPHSVALPLKKLMLIAYQPFHSISEKINHRIHFRSQDLADTFVNFHFVTVSQTQCWLVISCATWTLRFLVMLNENGCTDSLDRLLESSLGLKSYGIYLLARWTSCEHSPVCILAVFRYIIFLFTYLIVFTLYSSVFQLYDTCQHYRAGGLGSTLGNPRQSASCWRRSLLTTTSLLHLRYSNA